MKYLILFLFLVVTLQSNGQQIILPTTINEVTLYKSGALIERSGEANLQVGINTLTIGGLPSDLMDGSISVKAPEGIDVLSMDAEVQYNRPASDDAEILSLKQQILVLSDSIDLMTKRISALSLEKKNLQGQTYAPNEQFSFEDYKNLIAFKRETIFDIDKRILELERTGREIKSLKTKLENEISKKNLNSTSEYYEASVVVKVSRAGKAYFEVQYFIEDAGWKPKYDVIVDAINKPIELVYKAEVFQDSYEDWDDVRLIVSSGEPRFGQAVPSLTPYLLYFNNYRSPSQPKPSKLYTGSNVTGRVSDSYGTPLIGANILVDGTSVGTITDVDGTFSIQVPNGRTHFIVSYTGFENKHVPIYSSYIDVSLNEAELLDEVVITGYSRKSSASGSISEVRESDYSRAENSSVALRGMASGVQISAAIERYNPTVEYNLEKVTIEGLDDPKTIRLSSVILDTELFYRTIPKLEETAYLLARVKDWEDLNLQDGSYNVLFEGKYLTNYTLDLSRVEEDLELSLGIDEDIRVTRNPVKDFTSRTFLSKNIKEKKSWNITVANGKDVMVPIEILDHYPIANYGDIDVDVQELSEGKVDKEKGIITWNVNLPAKESVEKLITYEVKYPNDRNLIVD